MHVPDFLSVGCAKPKTRKMHRYCLVSTLDDDVVSGAAPCALRLRPGGLETHETTRAAAASSHIRSHFHHYLGDDHDEGAPQYMVLGSINGACT